MSTNEHHPSCRPNDLTLVWHCDQCGLNTPAVEDDKDKRIAELEAMCAVMRTGLDEAATCLEYAAYECAVGEPKSGRQFPARIEVEAVAGGLRKILAAPSIGMEHADHIRREERAKVLHECALAVNDAGGPKNLVRQFHMAAVGAKMMTKAREATEGGVMNDRICIHRVSETEPCKECDDLPQNKPLIKTAKLTERIKETKCYACGGPLGERPQCLSCWKSVEAMRAQAPSGCGDKK